MGIGGTSAVGKDAGATANARRGEFDQAVRVAKTSTPNKKGASKKAASGSATEKNVPVRGSGAAKATRNQVRPPLPSRGLRVPPPVKAPRSEPNVDTIKAGIKEKIGDYAAKGDLEMAGTHARVFMNLATHNLAVPAKALPDLLRELKAIRPGETALHEKLDLEALKLQQTWTEIGRSEDVFAPLQAAAEKSWWRNVEEIAANQFETLATTKPASAFISAHANLLRQYGPAAPEYRAAIDAAERYFLRERPEKLAAEVRQAFDVNLATGLTRLRETLDPKKVDPVTAALAFNAAEPAISKIPGHWSAHRETAMRGVHDVAASSVWMFRQLGQAVDSAGRGPESQALIDRLAQGFAERPKVWTPSFLRDMKQQLEQSPLREKLLLLATTAAFKDKGENGIADTLLGHAGIGMDRMASDTRNATADLLLEFKKHVLPDQRFKEFLTAEQREQGRRYTQEELSKPEAKQAAQALYQKLDQHAYELLRADSAFARYQDKLSGLPSSATVQEMIKATDDDPAIRHALMISGSSVHEALRSTQVAGLEQGAGYDNLLMHDAIEGSGDGRLKKALLYATMGIAPSFAILRNVTGGSNLQVAALLPEQFLRDATNLGLLDGLVGNDLPAPVGGLAKSAVAAGLIVTTTAIHNKIADLVKPGETTYKIGSLMYARLAIGPVIRLGEAALDSFYPKPPTIGPDGKPFYSGPAAWAMYEGIKGVNVAGSIAAVVVPYKMLTEGGKAVFGKMPSLGDLAGNWRSIVDQGWKAGVTSGGKTFGLVLMQWTLAQALNNRPEGAGFPKLADAYQDSMLGQAVFWTTAGAQFGTASSLPWLARAAGRFHWVGLPAVLTMEAVDHDRMVRQFSTPIEGYLRTATGNPQLARSLSGIDSYGHGMDARLKALAAYQGVEPKDIINWYEQILKKDPGMARSFAGLMLRDLQPVVKKVGTELEPDDFSWHESHMNPRPSMTLMQVVTSGTLESFATYVAERGYRLPGEPPKVIY